MTLRVALRNIRSDSWLGSPTDILFESARYILGG
jgi:hypothetical protein